MTVLINPYRFATSGGGGSFTPDDLDNRLGWYDYTNMTAGTAGSEIDEVTDRWGGFAPNAGAGDRPVWSLAAINSLDVADFSGTSWHYAADSELSTTPSGLPISVWAVFESPDATIVGNRYLWDTATGTSVTCAFRLESGGDNFEVFNGSAATLTSISTGWHRVIVVFKSGGTADVLLDGTAYNGVTVGTRVPAEIMIGRRRSTAGESVEGGIAELGWVDDELTSSEVSDLDSYLSTKYSL